MARKANLLSARTVATISEPGLYPDGGNLYLCATGKQGRSWVFIYKWKGKRTEIGLGSLQDVTLASARTKAASHREMIASGQNPKYRNDDKAIPTFGEMADEYIAAHEASWRNDKHVAQWKMTLQVYAAPLRSMPVSEIAVEDVLRVLKPLWQTRPETAGRLRGRIEAVLDAAKARRLRDGENPAAWKGNLRHLLPQRSKLTRGHHAAMPYADLSKFVRRLRETDAVSARALEFTILTTARTSEALLATWDEIDLQIKIWTVPALRMKAGREHRVPLCDRAVTILDEMKALGTRHLFPGMTKGKPLSSAAMSAVLERLDLPFTVHGFRSSFKDWARECTSFPNDLSEAALAHVVGDKVERAYARGDVLQRRRELAEAWAKFCEFDETSTNVVPLQQASR